MRGKVQSGDLRVLRVGITPAYAGKRFAKTIRVPQSRDHPRLCGEKAREATSELLGQGSPPPMRGKASMTRKTWIEARITPAYAGKSGD